VLSVILRRGPALLALLLAGACGGGQPRALVVVEVTKAPALPRFQLVRVTVAGVSATNPGDGEVKLGIYLSGDLKGPVPVRAEGVGADDTVVAEAMDMTAIAAGQVSTVRLTLVARPGSPFDAGGTDASPEASGSDARVPDGSALGLDGGDGPGSPPPDAPADLPAVAPDAPRDVAPDLGQDLPPGTPPAFGCPADNALVACYTFDGDTGNVISDGSGLSNSGTTDAVRVRGVHGMALRFSDGAQVAQVKNAPSLKLMGSNATIEAWVKPAMYPAEMALDFLVGKVGTGEDDGYAFGLYMGKVGGYRGAHGQLAGAVPTGVWTHVAVVWGPDGLSHYQNGTRVGSFGRLDLLPNDEPLTLGNRSRIGAPISSPYFAFYGELDVVRIYARARTAAEICADANRTMVGADCI
jgi:hypothetical protein